MNPTVWLMLMSFALVAPVMLGLLYVSLTGRIERDEDARFLPLADPDPDVWQEPAPTDAEGGDEP